MMPSQLGNSYKCRIDSRVPLIVNFLSQIVLEFLVINQQHLNLVSLGTSIYLQLLSIIEVAVDVCLPEETRDYNVPPLLLKILS